MMRILALETTDRAGSVAAFLADQLLAEKTLAADQRSAQSLAGGIQDLLAQVDWRPSDVELVVVAVGPGSFTGLRVGVTTAKTFAYAVGAEVFGVNTLEAIASQAPTDAGRLHVALDAQRRQVFAAIFESSNADTHATAPVAILDERTWLDKLRDGDTVTGPALVKLAAQIPAGVLPLDQALWKPTAKAVGQVAWRRYQAGERHDLWSLLPKYYRLSAAEEKLRGR